MPASQGLGFSLPAGPRRQPEADRQPMPPRWRPDWTLARGKGEAHVWPESKLSRLPDGGNVMDLSQYAAYDVHAALLLAGLVSPGTTTA